MPVAYIGPLTASTSIAQEPRNAASDRQTKHPFGQFRHSFHNRTPTCQHDAGTKPAEHATLFTLLFHQA